MSTTRSIAHNTIVQMIGKIISTIFGLLAVGMMTRYLGTEQFGWYVTAITFLQFIGIVIDFGLIPVTAQMLSELPAHLQQASSTEHEAYKEKLLKNLLGFRLVTAVIFLGIAPFIALFFPYPPEVKIAIAFSTISFLCICLNQILTGFFQYKLKMYWQSLADIVGRIVLVGGLWLFIYKHYGYLPIMGVVVASAIGYTLVFWLGAAKYGKLGFSFDWQIWKKIIKKMWPLAISIIFNVVYLRGDTVLLTFFRSQTEVGIYGAAYRVIDILSQMAMLIMGLMLPLMTYHWSRQIKDGFKKYYQQSFDTIMLITIPIVATFIMLGKPIMVLVAGKNFLASGSYLQILILAIGGVYLGAIFGHTAVAINRQKQTMWIYISNAIITLAGYLIFIPRYGAWGAAWMTVFSEFYTGLWLFIIVHRYTAEKLAFHTFYKIIVSGILMAAVLYFVQNLNVILSAILGALTYCLAIFGTGAISLKTFKEITSLKTTTPENIIEIN
jgi:O-antigen/teichoic acid export membrane protein